MAERKELNKFQNKVLSFMVALNNVYKDEEDQEEITKLELKEEELTEDFTAMLHALYLFYTRISGDEVDFIGFSHLCNRLAIQHVMEPKGGNENETH